MRQQYIEVCPVVNTQNEALESHCRRLIGTQYQWQITSSNVRSRNTDVSLTSESGCARHQAVSCPINNDRRLKCQRALNCWQRSALSRSYQHAQAARRMKNTSWLHPSLSRLSLRTQVSTSNTTTGQASAPVLTYTPATRGVSC